MSEDVMDTQDPVVEPASEGQGAPSAEANNWYDTLAPEFKENPSIKKYKSPDEFVKGHLELTKLIGKDKIPVPGEKSKPEEWAMVYDRLGRPAKPEEYKLSEVELPEGLSVDESSLTAFKEHAHNIGLSQKQADDLWKFYTETQSNQYGQLAEQSQKVMQDAEKALRGEWGTAYSEKLSLADKVLKQAAGKDYDAIRAERGNDPKFIKMLANLGAKMSEDSLGGDSPQQFGKTPDEANAEIKKIQGEMISNPKHPLNDSFHPEHKIYKEKLDDLYRQANPNI